MTINIQYVKMPSSEAMNEYVEKSSKNLLLNMNGLLELK